MYFRQPEYYNDFRCIGGSCGLSCCKDWIIYWTEQEIEKVRNAPNITEELRSLVEKTFKKSEDKQGYYVVDFNEKSQCPLLTEDGLCRLQKELGAEYLSKTCMIYPRYTCRPDAGNNNTVYRCCNLSCVEVSKRLITCKRAMNLVNVTPKESNVVFQDITTIDDLKKHPLYSLRNELLELFYEMLCNKRVPAESSIVRGAFLVKILDLMLEDGKAAEIPSVLSDIKTELISGKGFDEAYREIKPDLPFKSEVLNLLIKSVLSDKKITLPVDEDGNFSAERYQKGKQALDEFFGNDDFWLRNIALNLLLELRVPFYSGKYPMFLNYSYYVAALSIIKYSLIAQLSEGSASVDDLSRTISAIGRGFCQNEPAIEHFDNIAEKTNMVAPAAAAVLLI